MARTARRPGLLLRRWEDCWSARGGDVSVGARAFRRTRFGAWAAAAKRRPRYRQQEDDATEHRGDRKAKSEVGGQLDAWRLPVEDSHPPTLRTLRKPSHNSPQANHCDNVKYPSIRLCDLPHRVVTPDRNKSHHQCAARPQDSHEVALRGTTGFANSANGELAPMWYEDGHVIRLTATGFTQPELTAIAESLESAP